MKNEKFFRDDISLLEGDNLNIVVSKDKENIVLKGENANIVSTGSYLEISDNKLMTLEETQEYKNTGIYPKRLDNNSKFILTGNYANCCAGKNSTIYSSGDNNKIGIYPSTLLAHNGNYAFEYVNKGNIELENTESTVFSSGDKAFLSTDKSMISTGNDCVLYPFSETKSIVLGDRSCVFSQRKNLNIIGLHGDFGIAAMVKGAKLCAVTGKDNTIYVSEDNHIFVVPGNIINVTEMENSVIVVGWYDGNKRMVSVYYSDDPVFKNDSNTINPLLILDVMENGELKKNKDMSS